MADPAVDHHGPASHTTKRQFRAYNVMVILIMSFGSIAMGYSGSVIGTTLAQPTFLEYFELETRPDATSLISGMNGLFQAGAFFGAICISWVADAFGRKMSITIAASLVVISGALLASSVHIGMFLAFRFFAGMGSFWLLGAIPVWMTEIVPPRNRGLLVDIHSAALLFGYTSAGWTGYGFFHMESKNAWRAPLALQCLPALIVICAMPWLPESPRYLIQKGQHEKARVVLAKLHEDNEARVEFAQIQAQIDHDMSLPHSWMSLITRKTYRKRALFAVGLACGIQFTGVLVINSKLHLDRWYEDDWFADTANQTMDPSSTLGSGTTARSSFCSMPSSTPWDGCVAWPLSLSSTLFRETDSSLSDPFA